jgi:hypothetical protein
VPASDDHHPTRRHSHVLLENPRRNCLCVDDFVTLCEVDVHTGDSVAEMIEGEGGCSRFKVTFKVQGSIPADTASQGMERDSKGAGKGGKGKGRGDDGVKCAAGCGKAGTKRCNGCKAVFYCSVECQRIHWKENGHKAACKKTQASVAAAMASAAGGGPTHTGGSAAEGASVCIICRDVGDPPPIQSGCACRGDAGLAHVGCRVEAAVHESRSHMYDFSGWQECRTCGQAFTGQMGMGLAEGWWGTVQALHKEDEERQIAGLHLASSLVHDGRYAESEVKCRELRAVQQRMSGPASDLAMDVAQILAHALGCQNKHTEAEEIIREVLAKQRELLGAEHPDTLETLMSLGRILSRQGKLDDGLATFQKLRTVQERVLGAEHVNTMTTTMNIAATLGSQSKCQEAEVLLRELIGVQQRVLGAEHPATLTTQFNLCAALYDQHKCGEAEVRCRELLAVRRRVLGAEHPDTIATSRLLRPK